MKKQGQWDSYKIKSLKRQISIIDLISQTLTEERMRYLHNFIGKY